MKKLPLVIIGASVILAGLTACGSDAPASATAPTTPALTGASTPAATPAASASTPTVVTLMAAASCKGSMIGKQLYTVETGRCKIAGDEVTFATFAGEKDRDAWIKAGKDLGVGGVIISGPGWAAWATTQAAGKAVVAKLGGTVV